jgi:hypothetical protein
MENNQTSEALASSQPAKGESVGAVGGLDGVADQEPAVEVSSSMGQVSNEQFQALMRLVTLIH